jgi:hypothetical protein
VRFRNTEDNLKYKDCAHDPETILYSSYRSSTKRGWSPVCLNPTLRLVVVVPCLFLLNIMWTPRSSFRLTALARRSPFIRSYSKKSSEIRPSQQRSTEQDDGDFRPPWVYSASHILTYTLIPSAFAPLSWLTDTLIYNND